MISYVGDESVHTTDCTGADNQTHNKKKNLHQKYKKN